MSCEKNTQLDEGIQKGEQIIQIAAVSPQAAVIPLKIIYNDVIGTPIDVTVLLHLRDGQKKPIKVTVPAKHKNLFESAPEKFLNAWNYNQFYDSTRNQPVPSIDPSWSISSVEIIGVSTSDKRYGFELMNRDDWEYYQPQEAITSISFKVNGEEVSESNFDFVGNLMQYENYREGYYFNFFRQKVVMLSGREPYGFGPGATIKIPIMYFRRNGRSYGTWPEWPASATNFSSVTLSVTSLYGFHFDATFEGKLYSSMQSDTLYITEGKIKHAPYPKRVN